MAITPGQSKETILKNMRKKAYEVKFDLADTDYLPIENIGIGAYGVVCSAVHNKTKDRVAIKKIPQVFEDWRVATRTYREIKILKHFKHDNIIAIRDILKPKETMDKFRDVYVVFDLMESDLHRIIYSKQELSEEHVRYFLYQLLRGLKYIHSANVIHRDLKPSNLLVNEDCQLRIGDFGMARGVNMLSEEPNHFMTQYVATRWYRAPEIMLALIEYGAAVDMWSVGCIFAEMLGRKHLFPGKDYINQIKLIVGVVGSPGPDLLKLCQSDIIKKFITKLGVKTAISWNSLFPKASRKSLDLLGKMLVLHPAQRISVNDALKHLYLNKYHDPDDEPICVPTFDFSFEKQEKTKDSLRELIFKEVMEYHEPRTPTLSFNACLKPVPKTGNTTSPVTATPPNITLVKTNTGNTNTAVKVAEPFKQPVAAAETAPSLAVFTKNLQLTAEDIEMLSATRLTDSKEVTEVTNVKVEEKKPESLTLSKKIDKQHETTISSDTKALVKAALLNPNLKKQRSESTSEADDKNKPVTAAQRQREREEKRRKKREKALERKKNKEKKEKKPDQLLTDADRELLQRWAKMQKVNHPIAPKPEIKPLAGSSQNIQLTASSNAFPNPNMNSQPKQGFENLNPHVNQPQPPSLNSDTSQQGKSLIKVDTMHMLQQKLQARSAQNGQATHTNPPATSSVYENNQLSQQSQPSTTSANQQTLLSQQVSFERTVQNIPTVTSQPSDLSTINVDSLKMLGMSGSQRQGELNTIQDKSRDFVQMCPSDNASDLNYNSQQSEFNVTGQTFRDFQSQNSPYSNQGSPQKDYSNHSSPESYQSAASPECYGNDSQNTPDATPPRRSSQTDNQNSFSTQLHTNQNFTEPQNLVQNPLTNPRYFQQISSETMSSSSTASSNFPQQEMQLPFAPVTPDTDQMYTNVMQGYQQTTEIPFSNQGQNLNTFANAGQSSGSQAPRVTLPPPLSLGRQGSSPQPGPSNSDNPFTVTVSQDLISMLSKQFSKSQVEDPGPPALALTPRGTGAGYGLGMDLDTLMIDAQDPDSIRPELSPLSSSLLTDWMEVTGDLNIDMDALEQELSLQSPMALSYNDLSLYHN